MENVSFHQGGLLPVLLIVIFSAALVFLSPVAAIMGMAFMMLCFVAYGASKDERGKTIHRQSS